MLRWIGKRTIAHGLERLNAGDPSFLLLLDSPTVRFTFPGTSSWGGEVNGKQELRAWLQRVVEAKLKFQLDDVLVQGPPWRTTICVRGTDVARDDDGNVVYSNRFVLWGHLAWGRMREYEAYEDTVRSLAFDDYLRYRVVSQSHES